MAKRVKSCVIILGTIVLLCGLLCLILNLISNPNNYSVEQHIDRISKKVEQKYISDETGYTDFEVYPLYNENDAVQYFLVEFEPSGFMYVALNQRELVQIIAGVSMYTVNTSTPGTTWSKYTYLEESYLPEPTISSYAECAVVRDNDGNEWTRLENGGFRRETEAYTLEMQVVDKDGDCYYVCYAVDNNNNKWAYKSVDSYVIYHDGVVWAEVDGFTRLQEVDDEDNVIMNSFSHYKVAGALEQKKYLLCDGTVPAIKDGDTFISLISDKELAIDKDTAECEFFGDYIRHKPNQNL